MLTIWKILSMFWHVWSAEASTVIRQNQNPFIVPLLILGLFVFAQFAQTHWMCLINIAFDCFNQFQQFILNYDDRVPGNAEHDVGDVNIGGGRQQRCMTWDSLWFIAIRATEMDPYLISRYNKIQKSLYFFLYSNCSQTNKQSSKSLGSTCTDQIFVLNHLFELSTYWNSLLSHYQ